MDNSCSNLDILKTLPGYSAHFMDVVLWAPVIQTVCRERRLACVDIQAGTAGTYPTFLIDRSYVIKFFGPLFEGPAAYRVEHAVNNLLAACPQIPAARLLNSGQITAGGMDWSYLIFSFIPGQSYRADFDLMTRADRLSVAAWLGVALRKLHDLPFPTELAPYYPAELSAYQSRLYGWFEARLNCSLPDSPFALGLPPALAEQAGPFLENLLKRPAPPPALHLIHADMTRDHLMGEFIDNRWQIHAMIDFGDCMPGDLYYELAPLQLDFFDCDRELLAAFLSAYGVPQVLPADFPQRCLAAALQHRFNVFDGIFERHPEFWAVSDLDQLARAIWLPG